MSYGFLNELSHFFTFYNLIFLAEAVASTFLLSALGCIVGATFGFVLAIVRGTRLQAAVPIRILAIGFTELFRRIPFLVTLLLVFFVAQTAQLDLSLFTVALVSVCIIATAFLTEIIRGGLESVHQTQWDAAAVMNLSTARTLIDVVIPQAWKVILPPAFSFFILFIKDTALASQIGVVELTYAGKVLNNRGFPALLVFGIVLICYFCLSYPLSCLGAWMETRLAPARNRSS